MSKLRSWFSRHRIVGGVFGFIVAIAGGAMAAWLINDVQGDGYAKGGTLASPTFSAVADGQIAPGDVLLPGGTAPLTFRVSNPNTVPLKLVAIDGNGSIAEATADSDCPDGAIEMVAKSGLSITIAPSATNVLVTVPGAVSMPASTPSGCQGTLWKVPVLADFSAGS
jgi:hypothetical protein